MRKLGNCCAGDIVFYFKEPKPHTFEEAVVDVAGGGPFHVALCVSACAVIHATKSRVVYCSLEESCQQVDADWIEIFTVDEAHLSNKEELVKAAVDFAKEKIGMPYNDIFASNRINSQGNESYYCSQLIECAYSSLLFPYHSLNFEDDKGRILPFWKKYFSERGCPVPQGEPGSHPSQLMRAKFLSRVGTSTGLNNAILRVAISSELDSEAVVEIEE